MLCQNCLQTWLMLLCGSSLNLSFESFGKLKIFYFWKFLVSMFNVTQKSDLDFEPMKCTLQLASHLFNFGIILRDPVKECAVYISVFVYK